MTKRTYYANTIESALALARRELGEETLLLETGRAPAEYRHLGAYQVLAAVPAADPARWSRIAQELRDVRGELTRLSHSLGGSHPPAPAPTLTNEARRWQSRLVEAELPVELAQHWASAAEEQLGADARERSGWLDALCGSVRASVAFTGGLPPGGRGAVAFVGPAGAGKTSLLVKLAFKYGLQERVPLAIVSLDTRKVAASAALRTSASILGLPFVAADSPLALAEARQYLQKQELILIDTPGFDAREPSLASGWAGTLCEHYDVSTHLVLNAQARTADSLSAVRSWAAYRPVALAFTRIDETESLGGLLAVASRSRLPLSFFSAGQDVPESLEIAEPENLLRRIERGRSMSNAAA